jgi:hypothetical protein
LHGQEVFVPTVEAWRAILSAGSLDGLPLMLSDWIARWLDAYSRFEAASLGIVRRGAQGWLPLTLLRLGNRVLRVHFEDVLCEHCGQRCGASATPDTVAYAGTGLTPEQAWAELDGLPVQACPPLWRIVATATDGLAGRTAGLNQPCTGPAGK